ncbi:MAG: hypothetical protein CTY22_11715 [Methylomonas sp.]|nr:MAG: hypothetical protein CTY23_11905 [Methylomonas sp.]PPD23858.1 MAG: hypothetical protein CTY22_11715 [Methylomonas sp.]PPD31871.1 MAG: hypothetical protein CTY21_11720 [Methylomonas sp.]PPD54039.1 MAG: hypothetical protein CTY11_04580 [Methylomonas sp.]
MPNMALKRDAPYRGGFGGLLFFMLRWLRLSFVKGARLSFTLDVVLGWRVGLSPLRGAPRAGKNIIQLQILMSDWQQEL